MLTNLILTILVGAAGVMLLEKWKVDDYANTHPFLSRFWPANPCLLCRGFWIGCAVFAILCSFPNSIYVFVPLAAIPGQYILYGFYTKRL